MLVSANDMKLTIPYTTTFKYFVSTPDRYKKFEKCTD